jgi:hypothetical protein
VVQAANIAPTDRVRVSVEMVGAEGLDAGQSLVDRGFGGEEGLEGFVVRGSGAAGGHGVFSCSAGCGLASGDGCFQCCADRPDRDIVKVEARASTPIAGFQRPQAELLGCNLQQKGFARDLGGGCGFGLHDVVSGAWAVLHLQTGSLLGRPLSTK